MENYWRGEPPKHLIVFIPGYMGSQLRNRQTGELVWIDIESMLQNPFDIPTKLQHVFSQMRYPNDALVPDGIMDEVLFIPPFLKQEHYGRLIKILYEWGYSKYEAGDTGSGPRLLTFAYDWRQDNRISARKLAELIQDLKKNHPNHQIWIIAHSNGGIVARWFIEKEGGKEIVSRLFLLASPWDGAPKSMQFLQEGPEIFFLRMFNRYGIQQIIRDTALTFPSFYQLLPGYLPFLQDKSGNFFNVFQRLDWLSTPEQRRLLEDGYNFYREIGIELSVETLCFFGIKQPTVSKGVFSKVYSGRFEKIEWKSDEEGDGTVPIHSAIHLKASQKLPYTASHGDIYTHPAFLDKLKYELINRDKYGELAAVSTSKIKVHFQTDQDAYLPSEDISIQVEVSSIETGLPIYHVQVKVSLNLRRSFSNGRFSNNFNRYSVSIKPILLNEKLNSPGCFEGYLTAPREPGYYEVKSVISTKDGQIVECRELILVDAE